MAKEAVDMYSRAGKWDAAHKVAMGYLTDEEIHVSSAAGIFQKKAD